VVNLHQTQQKESLSYDPVDKFQLILTMLLQPHLDVAQFICGGLKHPARTTSVKGLIMPAGAGLYSV
jgi:hypothetical protein